VPRFALRRHTKWDDSVSSKWKMLCSEIWKCILTLIISIYERKTSRCISADVPHTAKALLRFFFSWCAVSEVSIEGRNFDPEDLEYLRCSESGETSELV
jgi:hypothetical protein